MHYFLWTVVGLCWAVWLKVIICSTKVSLWGCVYLCTVGNFIIQISCVVWLYVVIWLAFDILLFLKLIIFDFVAAGCVCQNPYELSKCICIICVCVCVCGFFFCVNLHETLYGFSVAIMSAVVAVIKITVCSRSFISEYSRVVYCYVGISSLGILHEAHQVVVVGIVQC
jgi:hypothetical protein